MNFDLKNVFCLLIIFLKFFFLLIIIFFLNICFKSTVWKSVLLMWVGLIVVLNLFIANVWKNKRYFEMYVELIVLLNLFTVNFWKNKLYYEMNENTRINLARNFYVGYPYILCSLFGWAQNSLASNVFH